jgi:RND family efflux transporter MFP subunit
MFIIEDESKKFLVAKVGQYDISDIKLNQEVTITSDVLGKDSAKGTVSRISPTGEKSSTANNTIVIPVKILVTKSDKRLITGVSAKAKIKTDSMKNVLKTSFENILSQGDKNFVFVIDNGTVKKMEIKTGLASTFDTQIISKDLKDGMQVVKNPDETLMDGEKVTVTDPNQMPAGMQGAPQGGQQGGVQYVDSGSNQEASQNSSESK